MESQFINPKIDLGKVKENEKVHVVFTGKEGMKNVKYIHPSCGCTKVEFKDGSLHAHYNTGTIPYHLGNEQFVSKTIYVEYDDNNGETLSFSLLVSKDV